MCNMIGMGKIWSQIFEFDKALFKKKIKITVFTEELLFLCASLLIDKLTLFLSTYRVLVKMKFEHGAYLSIALDSLTAWDNMSFLILCSMSSSWTLVHLWRAAHNKCSIFMPVRNCSCKSWKHSFFFLMFESNFSK